MSANKIDTKKKNNNHKYKLKAFDYFKNKQKVVCNNVF